MTTNPRFRAGQPASCAFVRSGCNWPEGGCAGNCMTRRVDASQLTDNRAVMVAGQIEFAGPEPRDEEQDIEWVGYLLAATLLTMACVGLGYVFGRYLS